MPDWTSLLPSAPSTPSAPVMPQYNFLTAADVLNAQNAKMQSNLTAMRIKNAVDQGDITKADGAVLLKHGAEEEDAEQGAQQGQYQNALTIPAYGQGQGVYPPQAQPQTQAGPQAGAPPTPGGSSPNLWSPTAPAGGPPPDQQQPSMGGPGQSMNALAMPQFHNPYRLKDGSWPAQGTPEYNNAIAYEKNILNPKRAEYKKEQQAAQQKQFELLKDTGLKLLASDNLDKAQAGLDAINQAEKMTGMNLPFPTTLPGLKEFHEFGRNLDEILKLPPSPQRKEKLVALGVTAQSKEQRADIKMAIDAEEKDKEPAGTEANYRQGVEAQMKKDHPDWPKEKVQFEAAKQVREENAKAAEKKIQFGVNIRNDAADKKEKAPLTDQQQHQVDVMTTAIGEGRMAPSQANGAFQRMGGSKAAGAMRTALFANLLEKGTDLEAAENNYKAKGSSTAIQRVQLAKTVVPIANEVKRLVDRIPDGVGFVPVDEATRKLGKLFNNEELIKLEFAKNKMVEEFERMLTGSQMADSRVQRNLELVRAGYSKQAMKELADEVIKISNTSTEAVSSNMYNLNPKTYWVARAKKLNPGMSDADIENEWDKKHGGK